MFPTITITGGSSQDNSQLCSVVQSALQQAGFTNVSLDPACALQGYDEVADMVSAMRRLNPDLFDIPLTIEGFCETESMVDLSTLNPDGFVAIPEVWNGNSPMLAPNTPVIGYAGQSSIFGSVGNFFSDFTGFFGQRPAY